MLEHCKKQNPPCVIRVTDTVAGASSYALMTEFDLSTLTANADFSLIVNPGVLAEDTANNPVILTDGNTALNLTMYNGNCMRESVFKPMIRRRSRCGADVRMRCFYGSDPAHALVWPSRRY